MTEVEMKFAWVPPGTFLMGSDKNDAEKPIHKVTISKGFYMGVFPVTQSQWRWVLGSDNRPSAFQGDDHPVEQVSWLDCQTFCARMGERTNKPIRLPTEAEWEFACQAGTTTEYYTGNGDAALARAGWYKQNSGNQTKPVGQLEANEFGLYDMHGNVLEWCSDWYGASSSGDIKDPQGAQKGDSRVLRGGSWADDAEGCRAACRNGDAPARRGSNCGFRVCFRLD